AASGREAPSRYAVTRANASAARTAPTQPSRRASQVRPPSAANPPTTTAPPRVTQVSCGSASAPASPAPPAASPMPSTTARFARNGRVVASTGGGGVSATPNTEMVKTSSAAAVAVGQGAPSAPGASSSVTARPGATSGTACRVTAPPNPTAASAAARVSTSAATTLLGWTAPESTSSGGGPCHGAASAWYGPTRA